MLYDLFVLLILFSSQSMHTCKSDNSVAIQSSDVGVQPYFWFS